MSTIKVSSNTLNPYETAKAVYTGSPLYSAVGGDSTWSSYAKNNNLDTLIGVLSEQDKLNGVSNFMNTISGYEYLNNDMKVSAAANELWGDRETLNTYKRYVTDDNGNYLYDDNGNYLTEDYETTEYEYYKNVLEQYAATAKYQADVEEEQKRKDDMNGFVRGMADVASAVMHLLNAAAENVYNVGKLISSPFAALNMDETSWSEFDKAWREWMGTEFVLNGYLNEFDRNYTDYMDVQGNTNGLGTMIISIADSIGQAVPSMIAGGVASKLGVTSSAFYTVNGAMYWIGMGVNTLTEYINDSSLNDVPTIALVGLSIGTTAMEALITKFMTATMGGSVVDKYIFGANTIAQQSLKENLMASGGKAVGQIFTRIAKSALKEGIEEVLQEFSTAFINGIAASFNNNFEKYAEYTPETMLKAFALGALSTVLTEGVEVIRTKRVDTNQVKIDKDGNIATDKKGNVKYKKFNLATSLNINDLMGKLMQTFTDVKNDKTITEELRNTQLTELQQMMRVLGQFYNAIDSKTFKDVISILNDMSNIDTTTKVGMSEYKNKMTKVKNGVSILQSNYYNESRQKLILLEASKDEIAQQRMRAQEVANSAENIDYERLEQEANSNRQSTETDTANTDTETEVNADDVSTEEIPPTALENMTDSQLQNVEEALDATNADSVVIVNANDNDAAFVATDDNGQTKLFLTPNMVNKTAQQIVKSMGIRALKTTLAARNKLAMQSLTKLYKRTFNTKGGVSNSTIVSALIVNYNGFLDIALQYANVDTIKLITTVYMLLNDISKMDTEKKLTESEEAIYKENLKQALETFTNALVRYYSIQYNADYNDIAYLLTAEQLEVIRKSRLTQDISNRFIAKEQLTTEQDRNVLRTLVNNMEASQDIKDDLLSVVNDVNAKQDMRVNTMRQISKYYYDKFSNKYDNVTYLENASLANSVFNNWLISSGYVINGYDATTRKNSIVKLMQDAEAGTLSNTVKEKLLKYYAASKTDIDKELNVEDGITEENFNQYAPELLNIFFRDSFNLYCGGLYQFEMITTSNETMGEIQSVKVTGTGNTSMSDEELTRSIKSGGKYTTTDEQYFTKLTTDANTYIADFISDAVPASARKYVTINDLIAAPDMVNSKTRNAIVAAYGTLNSQNLLKYLQDYFLTNYNNIQILQRYDGVFVLGEVTDYNKLVKQNVKVKTDTNTKGSISSFINAEFLYGNLKNITVIVTPKKKGTSYYNSSTNTIYVRNVNSTKEILFTIAHEFDHAVQIENNIVSGADGRYYSHIPKAQRESYINYLKDVIQHNPDYFADDIDLNTAEGIASVEYFVYRMAFGELLSEGLRVNFDTINPFVHNYNPNTNTLTLVTPWGNTYKFTLTNFTPKINRDADNINNLTTTVSTEAKEVINRKQGKNSHKYAAVVNARNPAETEWRPSGRYISSDNARGTNLEGYFDGLQGSNKRVQMDEGLQQFIVASDLANLDPDIAQLIRDGKLTLSHGTNSLLYYFRNVKYDAQYATQIEYTFAQAKKYIFKDCQVESFAKLVEYTDNTDGDVASKYATLRYINSVSFKNNRDYTYDTVDLADSKNGRNLDNYFSAIADQGGGQDLENYASQWYGTYKDDGSKDKDWSGNIDYGALRLRLIRYFDGTIASVYREYNLIRFLAKNGYITTDKNAKLLNETELREMYNKDNDDKEVNPFDNIEDPNALSAFTQIWDNYEEQWDELLDTWADFYFKEHPDETPTEQRRQEIKDMLDDASANQRSSALVAKFAYELGCIDETTYMDIVSNKKDLSDGSKVRAKRKIIKDTINKALSKVKPATLKTLKEDYPNFKFNEVKNKNGDFVRYSVDETMFQGLDETDLDTMYSLANTFAEDVKNIQTGKKALQNEVIKLSKQNRKLKEERERLQDKLRDQTKNYDKTLHELEFKVNRGKNTYIVSVSSTETMPQSVRTLFDKTFNNPDFYKDEKYAPVKITAAGDDFTITDTESVVVSFNKIYDEIIVELDELDINQVSQIIDYFANTGVVIMKGQLDATKRYVAIEAAILVNFLERARTGMLTLSNEQIRTIHDILASFGSSGASMLNTFTQAGHKINMFDKVVEQWSKRAGIEISESQLEELAALFNLPVGEEYTGQALNTIAGDDNAAESFYNVSEQEKRKALYDQAIANIYQKYTTITKVQDDFIKLVNELSAKSDKELNNLLNEARSKMSEAERNAFDNKIKKLREKSVTGNASEYKLVLDTMQPVLKLITGEGNVLDLIETVIAEQNITGDSIDKDKLQGKLSQVDKLTVSAIEKLKANANAINSADITPGNTIERCINALEKLNALVNKDYNEIRNARVQIQDIVDTITNFVNSVQNKYQAIQDDIQRQYFEYKINNLTGNEIMYLFNIDEEIRIDVDRDAWEKNKEWHDERDDFVQEWYKLSGEELIKRIMALTEDPNADVENSDSKYGAIIPSKDTGSLLYRANRARGVYNNYATRDMNVLTRALLFNAMNMYSWAQHGFSTDFSWRTDFTPIAVTNFLKQFNESTGLGSDNMSKAVRHMVRKLADLMYSDSALRYRYNQLGIESVEDQFTKALEKEVRSMIASQGTSVNEMADTLIKNDTMAARKAEEQALADYYKSRDYSVLTNQENAYNSRNGEIKSIQKDKDGKEVLSDEEFNKRKQDAYNEAYSKDLDVDNVYSERVGEKRTFKITNEEKGKLISDKIKEIELEVLAQYDLKQEQRKKKGNIWNKLLDFEKMAMLSSPSTWIRNATSNTMLYFLNQFSGWVGEKEGRMFKKTYARNESMTFANARNVAIQEAQFIQQDLDKTNSNIKEYSKQLSENEKRIDQIYVEMHVATSAEELTALKNELNTLSTQNEKLETDIDEAKRTATKLKDDLKTAKQNINNGKVYKIVGTKTNEKVKTAVHTLFDTKNSSYVYDDTNNTVYITERKVRVVKAQYLNAEKMYSDKVKNLGTATQIPGTRGESAKDFKVTYTKEEQATIDEAKATLKPYRDNYASELKKLINLYGFTTDTDNLAELEALVERGRKAYKSQPHPTAKRISFYDLVADGLSRYSDTSDINLTASYDTSVRKANLEKELEEAKAELAEQEQLVANYKANLETLTSERDALVKQDKELGNKYVEDRAKIDKELDHYQQLYNKAQTERADISLNVKTIQSKINEINTNIANQRIVMGKTQDATTRYAKEQYNKAKAYIRNYMTQLNELKGQLTEAQEDLHVIDETIKSHKAKVDSLTNQRKQLVSEYKTKHAELQKQIDEKKTQSTNTKRINKIQQKIESIESQLNTLQNNGTDTDGIIELISNNLMARLYTDNKFKSKYMKGASKILYKLLSDDPWIKSRTEVLLGAMITETGVSTDNMYSAEIMQMFAEAYSYAAFEYMHKSNFWNKLEQTIHEKTNSGYFFFKQIMPFISSSWNWFLEGLNYTPVGFARGIYQFMTLEKQIDKMNANAKYNNGPSGKFALYESYKNIGKGTIGTVGMIAGIMLAAMGIAVIDDEDDEVKLKFGNVYWDISDMFGSTGMLTGMVLGAVWIDSMQDGFTFDGFCTVLAQLGDAYMRDSSLYNMYDSLSFTDSMGEYLMEQVIQVPFRFVPNAWKLITSLINTGTTPKYKSGIEGTLQYYIGTVTTNYFTEKWTGTKYNVFTGEKDYKYGDAGSTFGLTFLNKLVSTAVGTWENYNYSEQEQIARSLGLNKSQLTGNYEDIGTLTAQQVSYLNQMYGKLNSPDLKNFYNNKTKYKVQDEKGNYVTLKYSQMTNKQRKSVTNRIMSSNASYAKIYVYTTYMGGKYYADSDTYKLLRSLGIKKNVYKETAKYSGFN